MYKRLLQILCVSIAIVVVSPLTAQVENVPLHHEVYNFLKRMNVKQIIPSIHDDNPSLARFEVFEYLQAIHDNEESLSNTEKKLLHRFELEFDYRELNKPHAYKDKPKFLYYGEKDNNNLFVELLSNTMNNPFIK